MKNYLILSGPMQNKIESYLPSKKHSEMLANFFYNFADVTRIKILSCLAVTEMCVNDIATALNMNQTTISHQLAILKASNTVDYRREGKIVIYFLAHSIINDCMLSAVNFITE